MLFRSVVAGSGAEEGVRRRTAAVPTVAPVLDLNNQRSEPDLCVRKIELRGIMNRGICRAREKACFKNCLRTCSLAAVVGSNGAAPGCSTDN